MQSEPAQASKPTRLHRQRLTLHFVPIGQTV